MAMQSPTTVAGTTFKIVKKGYDPDEVRAYLKEVSAALQNAQDHAANVEARARQAVARAQEAAQQAQAQVAAAPAAPVPSRIDDTETISRTLLLAQKTADETMAAAAHEAETVRAEAAKEADILLSAARAEVSKASETARIEARKATESERQRVEGELQQLLARLEFLRDDVTQMEAHAAHHRERLLQVAEELHHVATRPSAGLGESRRPVLSAAADFDPSDLAATQPVPIIAVSPVDDGPRDATPADAGAPEPVAESDRAIETPISSAATSVAAANGGARLFGDADLDAEGVDPDITAEVPVVE